MRFSIVLLTWACMIASAQQAGDRFQETIGDLGVNREVAEWTSPEAVLHDLHSSEGTVRGKAMGLVGVPYGDMPAQSELRYAPLSDDGTKQAVLIIAEGEMVYAAVAVPFRGAWRRIAVFDCWCKYNDWRIIDDFAQFEIPHTMPVGQRVEMVLHASGGGTGNYEQTEARFRVHNGAIKNVMSFELRNLWCQPTVEACEYERRWFDGNQLIEGRNPSLEVRADDTFREQLLGWEFEDSTITSFTCTPYTWDMGKFAYVRSGAGHPCKYEPPR